MLKSTVPTLQAESLEKQKLTLSPPTFLTKPNAEPSLTYLSQDTCRCCQKPEHWANTCPALQRKESSNNNLPRPQCPQRVPYCGEFSIEDLVYPVTPPPPPLNLEDQELDFFTWHWCNFSYHWRRGFVSAHHLQFHSSCQESLGNLFTASFPGSSNTLRPSFRPPCLPNPRFLTSKLFR